MQHQKDEMSQEPDRPPMSQEVFVGYGAGAPEPGNKLKVWWEKVRAVVWPPLASPARRSATVGAGVLLVGAAVLGFVLVSDGSVREFVADMNGGHYSSRPAAKQNNLNAISYPVHYI